MKLVNVLTRYAVIPRLSPHVWLAGGVCVVAGSASTRLPGVIAVELSAIAALVAAAALVDVRERRLPNEYAATATVVVAATAVTVVAWGYISVGGTLRSIGWGVAAGGALLLLIAWVMAPAAIGGGDVKLLAVIGAALGLADPVAALIAGWTAVTTQLIASVMARRQSLPFGPALFIGYVVGAVSTMWFHSAPSGDLAR